MDETTDINNQTVTMNIPLEDANTPPIVETVTSYPQEVNFDELALKKAGIPIENEELSTLSSPQAEMRKEADPGAIQPVVGEKVKDPNRNEKGQFVEGNTASVGSETNGRPCGLCQETEKYMEIFKRHLEKGRKVTGEGKVGIPWLEEVCLDMDIDEDTIHDWAFKKTPTGELEHPVFFRSYKSLMLMQKVRLKQRTQGRYNPTGAIFLLKANHGLMETEKKLLATPQGESLQIEIIEERPKPNEE